MTNKPSRTASNNNWQFVVIAILAALLLAATMWGFSESSQANQQRSAGPTNHAGMNITETLDEHGIALLDPSEASNSIATAEQLTYLLEEEKLSHDVYQAMYDKWGPRVFSNIQGSESMHQKMILALMESRNLPDPRTEEVGKFNDTELQQFYDQLIAQGSKSEAEAYKVGVATEERDIADLKQTLASLDPKDTDIKDIIENLIHSSENHLRAFNRQLDR